MPTYLIRTHGFTPGEAGFGYGLAVLIGGISGLITSGVVANRLAAGGRRDASIIVALGCTLIGLLPAIVAPIVPSSLATLLLSGVSVFGFAAAVALAPVALPVVVPNEMRGQIYALYLLIVSILGYAVGPVIVAIITDHIFRDDAMVGRSMALVASVVGPIAALLWAYSRKNFRTLISD